MPQKRRSFQRRSEFRPTRKLFVIASEGSNTEHQYFNRFNSETASVHIKCLKKKTQSSPKHVLAEMKKYLKEQELRKGDQAWLVVDKDDWKDSELLELFQWSTTKDAHGFALSNPMFEYWLLLHFEDGNGVSSARDCKEKLKKHLPNYDKNLDVRTLTLESVQSAISRAETKDRPPCVDWPRQTGTTVYRLVKSLLAPSTPL